MCWNQQRRYIMLCLSGGVCRPPHSISTSSKPTASMSQSSLPSLRPESETSQGNCDQRDNGRFLPKLKIAGKSELQIEDMKVSMGFKYKKIEILLEIIDELQRLNKNVDRIIHHFEVSSMMKDGTQCSNAPNRPPLISPLRLNPIARICSVRTLLKRCRTS